MLPTAPIPCRLLALAVDSDFKLKLSWPTEFDSPANLTSGRNSKDEKHVGLMVAPYSAAAPSPLDLL